MTTANLSLPYIEAAQAQKHVTHNEALNLLDSIVQLSVLDRDLTAPPGSPAEGDRYIVAAGASGAWAGWDGDVALFSGGAWVRLNPQTGWRAWVADEDLLLVHDGTSWNEFLQNIPKLGINTSADTTNRLSVAAPATLLSNEGAGHQLKINKAADTDTASLLFQSNWTGHAEMGLVGDTDFSIKVSDGASWFTALKCAASNGRVSFPAGVTGTVEVFDTGNSVFIGQGAGINDDLSDNRNIFIGKNSGNLNTSGSNSVAVGYASMLSNTTGGSNVGLGTNALLSNTTGSSNLGIGTNALRSVTTGNNNLAVGTSALYYNTGNNNVAVGGQALFNNQSGSSNAAVGYQALSSNTVGSTNAALGVSALRYTTTGDDNTSYSNCAGVGYDTRVSGSNQVQLGNSSTTTYAYGAIQDRSDARDKADVRDTVLGLDFITRLRPVDFRWDMRDDYFDEVEEVDPETGETVRKLVPVPKDGSRKRRRFHHGLIAQEVAQVLAETGIDFGGFQDHNYSGDGEDVLTIGYTELIAPLIRAVQELTDRVRTLEAKVAP